jgi:hypothetical protein
MHAPSSVSPSPLTDLRLQLPLLGDALAVLRDGGVASRSLLLQQRALLLALQLRTQTASSASGISLRLTHLVMVADKHSARSTETDR